MPSRAHCCVPHCTNSKEKCKWGLFAADDGSYERRRLCGAEGRAGCKNTEGACRNLSFHRLPTCKKLRAEWAAKIRRVNLPQNANTYVCGVHFGDSSDGGGRRIDGQSVPGKFLWSTVRKPRRTKVAAACRTEASELGRLVSGSPGVLHHDPDDGSLSETTSALLIGISDSEDDKLEDVGVKSQDDVEEGCTDDAKDKRPPNHVHVLRLLQERYADLMKDLKAEQARVASLKWELEAALKENEQLKERVKVCGLSYERLKASQTLMKFYTGLEAPAFELLLNDIVGVSKTESCRPTVRDTENFQGYDGRGRHRTLLPENELLLTLCKLRHKFPEEDLAVRFGVHQSTISRIFACWLETLDAAIQEVPLWPAKDDVQELMPSVFKVRYGNTRCIVDAAEVEIDQPQNPDAQSETWSEYKSRNTLKFLLAVTPNGVPCLVSKCYGGRISDKELTTRSGLLEATTFGKPRFEPGDSIMADKGFDIASLLAPHGIELNHPPYLRDRQFSEEDVVETRRIASLRIHVERAIERIKNYRILEHIPATLCTSGSRIVRICTFLTTLMPPLLPPD